MNIVHVAVCQTTMPTKTSLEPKDAQIEEDRKLNFSHFQACPEFTLERLMSPPHSGHRLNKSFQHHENAGGI